MARVALLIACLHFFAAPVDAQDIFLAERAKPKKPHILLVLADDLGYGNVGWNRKYFDADSAEVQTPELDQLASEGVHLTRFYVYHMCGPTRSALQTGRYPIHVSAANQNAEIYNAEEASGIGAGIPRNMTGFASKMREAGYRTHMAGKWDAGMATPTHTPVGRGFETQLCYFHHANQYWGMGTSKCDGLSTTDFYDTDGPAYDLAAGGKSDHRNISAYEDYILQQRLLSVIKAHDPSEPLLLWYSAHLVHLPYQVPDQYRDKLAPVVDNSSAQGDVRLTYAAMVNFLDGVVGNLTSALKAKGMWEDTLMIFFSDNGGPIYVGGNNYPLRGGKYSEFEGGVRSAAFVSGGFLPQSVRGTVHNGLGSVADVYSTLCGIAGVSAVDDWAAASGLPAVDGVDLSDMLLKGAASPRADVPLSVLHSADLNKWDEYDYWHQGSLAAVGTAAGAEEVDDGGWCNHWSILDGVKKATVESEDVCWQACRDNAQCMQATFESAGKHPKQCVLGGLNMTKRPIKNKCDSCVDHCYAKYGFGEGPAPTPPAPTPSPTPAPQPTPKPPKRPTTWKVQQCDILDKDLKVQKNIASGDCGKLCVAEDGCVAAVFEQDTQSNNKLGTCRLKKSAKQQIVDKVTKKTCFVPGELDMPAPITGTQAGIVVGDMKLIMGTEVSQTVWTGPTFPNASTPWTIDGVPPSFQCSTPYKIGCLFNVSADPTEHNDLAELQPEVAKRLLDRLRVYSATYFNPDRGDHDPRACKQVQKNKGFYGPWLELE